ncbi:N-acetylmuramoyl-L-alanine amidase [Calderihabitans maritimus]|uniref:N-acetylmuramoyl-L-alanine amidase n=1 Tax=Calderihabitans maritimus TaxID=1246530 RepID=A0A1Z5HVQ7_9FIRM|nr:N-acetylmuramoyl-L-alanine amidase [Calderihabitans maritimus]GAW93488.1 N-acetylmuramoyl-L-alanine amidase [Calderihabitans maritimus]
MSFLREYIILHHTGAEEKNARQVRLNHLRKGWKDIGYNYVIERDGTVVPGRSLELPGAHTRAAGMNYRSIGVALIGNFELTRPTPMQLNSLLSLLKRLQEEHRIPGDRILGHREVPGAKTLCPGRNFPLDKVREGLQEPVRWWRVQVGAFREQARAYRYAEWLRSRGLEAIVVSDGKSN